MICRQLTTYFYYYSKKGLDPLLELLPFEKVLLADIISGKSLIYCKTYRSTVNPELPAFKGGHASIEFQLVTGEPKNT